MRVGFFVAGLAVEVGVDQAGEAIAVDAPGGDPAQLGLQGLLQAVAGEEWFVVFDLLEGKRGQCGLEAQSHLSPGVKAVY
ncbi:hypothetical protein D3C87_1508070 [compost metagenome]